MGARPRRRQLLNPSGGYHPSGGVCRRRLSPLGNEERNCAIQAAGVFEGKGTGYTEPFKRPPKFHQRECEAVVLQACCGCGLDRSDLRQCNLKSPPPPAHKAKAGSARSRQSPGCCVQPMFLCHLER